MSSQPRIAIVGGGPAGLTLGVLLHQQGIPFTVFDLREKPTEEELAKPSGMLDLHDESGLAVIKQCGLYDDFVPLTKECSEEFRVADRDGCILYIAQQEGENPEISRHSLVKLLMNRIPESNINWGHRLISATTMVTSSNHAETELDFGFCGKYTFDLVVGADGAFSKIRNLVTKETAHFSGMHLITLTIKEVTRKFPRLAEFVGPGSFGSFGNQHALISQRGSMDSSRVYLWLSTRDESFATVSGLAGKPVANAKVKVLGDDALLGSFGPSIKELVATACDEESTENPTADLDIRALYTLPYGSSWNYKTGITLVGDAAHLMLPNGEGVNMAMLDSFLLSEAIIKACKADAEDLGGFLRNLDPLLRGFEDDMFKRAEETGKVTETMLANMFGTNDAGSQVARSLRSLATENSVI
jgi:2-polyprenyl-6-methoxyphenol hydroxylase-like FAD-dependent oxidoreductase